VTGGGYPVKYIVIGHQDNFIDNYGSTEGGPVTAFLSLADKVRKMGSVGQPSFGVEVRIVDKQAKHSAPA
jgi:acyl-CoA synthetase (AMP-forming)/AMP-acid ligase II